jgi:hypothetical protein
MNKHFYTTDEYAAIYRYADSRPVLRLIKRGKLKAIRREDGRYLIPARYLKGVSNEQQTANTGS